MFRVEQRSGPRRIVTIYKIGAGGKIFSDGNSILRVNFVTAVEKIVTSAVALGRCSESRDEWREDDAADVGER